jgi:DNA topoisomerase-1
MAVTVKAGRFGPYVTDGTTNATLPKTMATEAVTLDEAIELLKARRASGNAKKTSRGRKAPAKKTATKVSARKTPAKKSVVKKSAARKSTARKSTTGTAAKPDSHNAG